MRTNQNQAWIMSEQTSPPTSKGAQQEAKSAHGNTSAQTTTSQPAHNTHGNDITRCQPPMATRATGNQQQQQNNK